MSRAIIQSVEELVTVLLNKTLGEKFTYHNLIHTQSVVRGVDRLSVQEGLSTADQEIVIIAAWFHDTGFIVKYDDHEEESLRIAERFLQLLNYPAVKIKSVKDCIAVTRRESSPGTLLQNIVRDADYRHLFETDYQERVIKLRNELQHVKGKTFTDKQWWSLNLAFLNKHSFFTPTYRELWAKVKPHVIEENTRILSELD